MTAPLLDTQAWIWWVTGDDRMSPRARRRLDQLPADRRPFLSAISLWEAAMLANLGRIVYRPSFDAWLRLAADPATVNVLPITSAIAVEVARLPDTFRRDPADRLIVATARAHHLSIVTSDRAILNSNLLRPWRG